MAYNALVFSSGGVRGIAHFGALHALHQLHPEKIENVSHFLGTSAGAIAAFAAIHRQMSSEQFFRTKILPFEYNTHVFQKSRNESLHTFVDHICPKDLTFESLFNQTGQTLCVIGSNLTRKQTVIFDHIRTPKMTVNLALKISCAVPILFPTVRCEKTGDILLDGALTNAFPIDIAREEYGCERILGFKFSMEKFDESDEQFKFLSFLGSLIDTFINKEYQPGGGTDICLIECGNINSLRFSLSTDEKDQLFELGARSCMTFFDQKKVE